MVRAEGAEDAKMWWGPGCRASRGSAFCSRGVRRRGEPDHEAAAFHKRLGKAPSARITISPRLRVNQLRRDERAGKRIGEGQRFRFEAGFLCTSASVKLFGPDSEVYFSISGGGSCGGMDAEPSSAGRDRWWRCLAGPLSLRTLRERQLRGSARTRLCGHGDYIFSPGSLLAWVIQSRNWRSSSSSSSWMWR